MVSHTQSRCLSAILSMVPNYKLQDTANNYHYGDRNAFLVTRLLFYLQVLYELPTSTQWCFDIQWCPRNPAVLSAAAFDGHISIYSIMGGSSQAFSQTQADTVGKQFHI